MRSKYRKFYYPAACVLLTCVVIVVLQRLFEPKPSALMKEEMRATAALEKERISSSPFSAPQSLPEAENEGARPPSKEDEKGHTSDESGDTPPEEKKYIKWVEFNVPYSALKKALSLDIKYYGTETPMPWDRMLALLACKYGGDFNRYKEKDLIALAERVKSGETIDSISEGLSYYPYFSEAYNAILGGMVGEYDIQVPSEEDASVVRWEHKYGLKAFSPIARGYDYGHYDDFGSQRSYGYARRHLGHDMLGAVGTPIVAIESGVVEAIGWNQYGGWRIGIRSFDKRRYYYYAHLRKNHPYHYELSVGDVVMAGDVIGYLGMTGYSIKENVNNISTPHLHVGMELIFNEAQKDGVTQIWIDLYPLTRLLSQNTSPVYKNEETRDYYRKYAFHEEIPEGVPWPIESAGETSDASAEFIIEEP